MALWVATTLVDVAKEATDGFGPLKIGLCVASAIHTNCKVFVISACKSALLGQSVGKRYRQNQHQRPPKYSHTRRPGDVEEQSSRVELMPFAITSPLDPGYQRTAVAVVCRARDTMTR